VPWLLVIVAGLLEVGFATLLKMSDGLSRLWPTLGFIVFAAGSFTLLSLALRDLPIGTAYAVWTGIGAAGTALLGMVVFGDPATVARLVAIALIVGGVLLLNLAGSHG
jgi:quaternary ammonium compound-resistance protein SugE